MKRIRGAAVSQVEKWAAQLEASRGINIQKRNTKKRKTQKRANNKKGRKRAHKKSEKYTTRFTTGGEQRDQHSEAKHKT